MDVASNSNIEFFTYTQLKKVNSISQIIATNYEGTYHSSTKSPISADPIRVDLKFGPIDLLMCSYASCMLGTVDFYARKKDFEVNASRRAVL